MGTHHGRRGLTRLVMGSGSRVTFALLATACRRGRRKCLLETPREFRERFTRQMVDTRSLRSSTAGHELAAQDVGASSHRHGRAYTDRVSALRIRGQDRMRQIGKSIRQMIAEYAVNTPAPGCIGQNIDGGVVKHEFGIDFACHGKIVATSLAQTRDDRLRAEEVERISVTMHDLIQRRRWDDKVADRIAVGVVGKVLAKFPQFAKPLAAQREGSRRARVAASDRLSPNAATMAQMRCLPPR